MTPVVYFKIQLQSDHLNQVYFFALYRFRFILFLKSHTKSTYFLVISWAHKQLQFYTYIFIGTIIGTSGQRQNLDGVIQVFSIVSVVFIMYLHPVAHRGQNKSLEPFKLITDQSCRKSS